MINKQIYGLLLGALLFWGAPLAAEETNLLKNGSFDDYSCNMLGCQWSEWSTPLGQSTANTTDKVDGEASLQLDLTTNYTIDNPVTLGDDNYAAGTTFEVKMYFKVLELPEGGIVSTDCYWEPKPGGDADAMKLHDAAQLQKNIATAVSTDWDSVVVYTTKPDKSAYLRIRVRAPKKTKVLFDAFSVRQVESTEPYINVTPTSLSSVATTVGNTATFQTLHISQGHLNGPTTFELSYTDADQFSLSAASLAADQSECDLIITYAPKQAGTHVAYLNIDNLQHTTLHRTIKLEGTCTDPSAKPVVTVTPSVLPDFEAVAGQKQTKTVTVTSANLTDFIYLKVDHIQGAAFIIDGTMLSKNSQREVTVSFKPQETGTFQSTLTLYSDKSEFEPIVLTLNGTGKAATPETVDWQTEFVWNDANPLTYMDEGFDDAAHNKTLKADGWQNVAAAEARPWWGFDEAKTMPARGDGKYAKATAYQFGKSKTAMWEMWLMTPALDYKNTATKLFAFDVMGEYLPEEGIEAQLEVYYIDATNPAEVLRQDLTPSFSIPSTADENLQWITFYLDLTPYAATMADVFHMAFRYVGPNGADGAVTYYIDNVSWGKKLQGIESVGQPAVSVRKILRNGQVVILRGDGEYTVLGERVR